MLDKNEKTHTFPITRNQWVSKLCHNIRLPPNFKELHSDFNQNGLQNNKHCGKLSCISHSIVRIVTPQPNKMC